MPHLIAFVMRAGEPARAFALGRHEAPLPTSVACNAQCVGCLSLQPDGAFRAAHERLTRICFIDYDREIALVAERGGADCTMTSTVCPMRTAMTPMMPRVGSKRSELM